MVAASRLKASLLQPVHSASYISSAGKGKGSTGAAIDELADESVHQPETKSLRAVKKVAIVDDEKDMITIYEFVIKSLGLEMEFVAYDGNEIVEAIVKQQARPDIIIMDHRLQRMHGLEAATRILEIDKSIRIILATADDSVIEKARSLGLQTIQKPFSIPELKELLLELR